MSAPRLDVKNYIEEHHEEIAANEMSSKDIALAVNANKALVCKYLKLAGLGSQVGVNSVYRKKVEELDRYILANSVQIKNHEIGVCQIERLLDVKKGTVREHIKKLLPDYKSAKVSTGTYHRWTSEQVEWLEEEYDNYSLPELTEKFNQQFNLDLNQYQLDFKHRKKKSNRFNYTDEMQDWLKENYPKYMNSEVVPMFNRKFGTNLSWKALRAQAQRMNILKLNRYPSTYSVGELRKTTVYQVKVAIEKNQYDTNWVTVPAEVVENNELVPNAALAYGTIKKLSKEVESGERK